MTVTLKTLSASTHNRDPLRGREPESIRRGSLKRKLRARSGPAIVPGVTKQYDTTSSVHVQQCNVPCTPVVMTITSSSPSISAVPTVPIVSDRLVY